MRSDSVFWVLVLMAFGIPTLPSPARPDSPPSPRYRAIWPIEVEDVDWTSVSLSGEALAHADIDLAVIGPDGTTLDAHLADQGRRGFRVSLGNVDKIEQGWRLYMDLGSGGPSHGRLRFQVAERVAAEGCVLRSSEDRRTWHRLTEGDLFRVGEGEDLESLVLDYPSTNHRYLQLDWPVHSLPHLRSIQVFELEPAVARTADAAPNCESRLGSRVCLLDLPKASHRVRRLDLEVRTDQPWGYRLLLPDQGRWRTKVEGSRAHGGSTTLTLDGIAPRRFAESAILELYGEEEPPTLESAIFQVAGVDLIFRPEQTGRHQVVWGGAVPSTPPQFADSPKRSAKLGDLEKPSLGPWPALPESLVAPGASLPDAEILAEWPIEITDLESGGRVEAGDIVRLRLPLGWESLRGEGSSPGWLRLVVGERQLPHVKVRSNEPRKISEGHSKPLQGTEDPRLSFVEVPLDAVSTAPDSMPGWSEMQKRDPLPIPMQTILGAEGPFDRTLSAYWQQPGRPGVDATKVTLVPPTPWRCLSSSFPPCSISLYSQSFPRAPMTIEFEDGNDTHLPSLYSQIYVPREELFFVWPEGAPPILRLYESSSGNEAGYDLEALRSLLRLRPAVRAHLGDPVFAQTRVSLPPWALPTILGLAVLVLGWLLARLVRSGDA